MAHPSAMPGSEPTVPGDLGARPSPKNVASTTAPRSAGDRTRAFSLGSGRRAKLRPSARSGRPTVPTRQRHLKESQDAEHVFPHFALLFRRPEEEGRMIRAHDRDAAVLIETSAHRSHAVGLA